MRGNVCSISHHQLRRTISSIVLTLCIYRTWQHMRVETLSMCQRVITCEHMFVRCDTMWLYIMLSHAYTCDSCQVVVSFFVRGYLIFSNLNLMFDKDLLYLQLYLPQLKHVYFYYFISQLYHFVDSISKLTSTYSCYIVVNVNCLLTQGNRVVYANWPSL